MKHFYERNDYILNHEINKTFEEIGIFKLHSCTSKKGIYKVSYAQIDKKLNLLQIIKKLFL